MFLEHFGLIEQPFGVTPDPRFLYLGKKHREALASLVYGTETNRGFLALVAKPGMGKTTLLYQYLETMRGRARSAFLFQTEGDTRTLMRHLLMDLGLESDGKDLAGMHGLLNRFLVEEMNAGRRFILVIDEAQNLDERVLEFVRLLSNFETPWKKLMHIVISGQPQLAEKLTARSMEQLRQRISSIIRIEPFTAEETCDYIRHRLWIGGHSGPSLFTAGAQLLIARKSAGIPRNINNLCFHSMSLAYALGRKQVDSLVVREALADLEITPLSEPPKTAVFAAHKIFSRPAPLPKVRVERRRATSRRATWRLSAAFAAICAAVLVFVVSGNARKISRRAIPARTLAKTLPALPETGNPSWPAANLDENAIANPSGLPAAQTQRLKLVTKEAGPKAAGLGIETITVQHDDTLRHLCLTHLGRFDVATLVEISSLNPAIVDPNHIESGQLIRMPLYLRPGFALRTQKNTNESARQSPGGEP
jgi:type II secretory pathway predicted ATPase ExeA